MKILDTPIKGLLIIKPDVFFDQRGHFFESYNKNKLENEIKYNFIQDNQSLSKKGTLRGIHLQLVNPQGKLVRVTNGRAFDVAIDLRPNSVTFGQHFSIILDPIENNMLWIPPGFGHGFLALEDDTILQYKVTEYYNSQSEVTIVFNDPDLAINWPSNLEFIISNKDKNGLQLSQFSANKS